MHFRPFCGIIGANMVTERPSGESAPSSPQLFDPIPEGVDISPEELRQQFDGTTFNGANALRVEFDEQGNVLHVSSFNLYSKKWTLSFTSDHEVYVPFIPVAGGGWRGEGGYYGPSTVLGNRMEAIVSSVKEEWRDWKATEEEHPGVDFRTWKAHMVRAMGAEARRLREELPRPADEQSPEDMGRARMFSAAMQRHYDYFVRLFQEGRLTEADKVEYDLAMERERRGEVKPYSA